MGKQLKICISCGAWHDINEDCECKKERDEAKKERKRIYQREYDKNNSESVKPLKTQRWRRFRKRIIHRDGGYCQRCLIKFGLINSQDLEVHHITPRIERPDLIFVPENCLTLCKYCNTALGTGDLDFEPNHDKLNDDMIPNI